jgi:hypothetical protein
MRGGTTLALLLKHVLILRLRRKGVFLDAEGKKLSKLTLEEIQREYERIADNERGDRDGLVKSNA